MEVYNNENVNSNLLPEEGTVFNAKTVTTAENSSRGNSPLTQKNVQQFDSAFHHETVSQPSQGPGSLRSGRCGHGRLIPVESLSEADFNRGLLGVHLEIDQIIGSLRGELDYWRSEFRALQDLWRSKQEQDETDANKIACLADFRTTLEVALDASEKDKSILDKKLEKIEKDHKKLKSTLLSLQAANEELRAENSALRKSDSIKDQTLASMKDEKEKLAATLEDRLEEIETLKQSVDGRSERIEAYSAELARLRQVLADERRERRETEQFIRMQAQNQLEHKIRVAAEGLLTQIVMNSEDCDTEK